MTTRSKISHDKKSGAGRNAHRGLFFKKEKSTVGASKDTFFSPKVAIGEANDKYEKEADAVADHVVNSMGHASVSQVQMKCATCDEEERGIRRKEEEEEPVQLKADIEDDQETVQKKSASGEEEKEVQLKALDSRLNDGEGRGNSLSPDMRREMETSFGADFGHVGIHTDQEAVQLAQGLGAQAFTHGSDIYFNRGKYDTSSSEGKRLLAHELTHVVQQGSTLKKKRIQRQLAYGSGYAGYSSAGKEIRNAKAGTWNPTSVDFRTNAGRSGGGTGVKDLPELIKAISAQGKGTIKNLGIIGHSNSRALGLSGDVHAEGVPLRGLITEATLQSHKAEIDAVKDRFTDDAAITLYSCNSGGVSSGLADAVSVAFGVCVKGFKNYVMWCITFNESPAEITSRGNVYYENPNDPLAGTGIHPSCASFHKRVLDLTPDVSSCKGVKTGPEKKCVPLPDIPLLEHPGLFQLSAFSHEGVPDAAKNSRVSSEVEGLRKGDGLVYGTFHLRPRVSRLQELLIAHGNYTKVDGMFGPKTEAALNIFQASNNISTSHVVDRATADALEGRNSPVCPAGHIPVITV